MNRAALEIIGQSGLGYSFDSLQADSIPHPYSAEAKKFSAVNIHLLFARTYILPIVVKFKLPRVVQRFIVNVLPWNSLHMMRDVVDILHSTSVEIIESKKKALRLGDEEISKQIGHGKDIISTLSTCSIIFL